MLFRAALVVVAIVTAGLGSASPANSQPICPAGPCALAPAHSPSYQDGYNSEYEFYSIQRNRIFLKNEMQKGGYDTLRVCQLEITGGTQPPNENDWLQGCIDALHDLGFKP